MDAWQNDFVLIEMTGYWENGLLYCELDSPTPRCPMLLHMFPLPLFFDPVIWQYKALTRSREDLGLKNISKKPTNKTSKKPLSL